MATRSTKDDLEIKISAAASPGRVLIAAQMIQAALHAADASLPEDAVTMVVSNYNMSVGLRPQIAAGKLAMAKIRRVIENPLKEVQKHPASQLVAEALSRKAGALAPFNAEVLDGAGKKRLATIDKKFIDVLGAAGRHALKSGDFLDGGAEFHTLIYRVGRAGMGPKTTARIQVDGTLHEIRVSASGDLTKRLFDYARDKKTVRVGAQCRWLRGEGDRWEFDFREMKVISVEEMDPVSGKELLTELTSGFSRSAQETREWMDDFIGDT